MNYHRQQRLLIGFLIALKKNDILPTSWLFTLLKRVKIASSY
jgi:hypothetical protein